MISASRDFRIVAAHDLRLATRRIAAMARGSGGRRTVVFAGFALVAFHALAWPAAVELADETLRDPHAADGAVAAGFLFVLPWIVSQSLTNATRALYARGDLDLLLSSPISPAALFAARAVAIAIESIVSVAIFLLPIADALALAAGPHWLALYPCLAICGLAGTSVGLLLTMALFRIAGPRRTRVLSQILATLVGASFALGLQAINFLPAAWRETFRTSVAGRLLALPVRAAMGDPSALALGSIGSVVAFVLVARLLGVAFADGATRATDIVDIGASRGAPRRFRSGSGQALRRKEWRLLRRDPWLGSQLLLQAAYTVPLCVVLARTLGPEHGLAAAVAPGIVVVAAQLSGALTWVALSTEDAPELLQTAPVPGSMAMRAKLSIVAMLVALALILPLLFVASGSTSAAFTTALFGTGGVVSTALLNVWQMRPVRRGTASASRGQPKLIAILEHVLVLLWAVSTPLFAAASWLFAMPIVLAIALLAASRRLHRMA